MYFWMNERKWALPGNHLLRWACESITNTRGDGKVTQSNISWRSLRHSKIKICLKHMMTNDLKFDSQCSTNPWFYKRCIWIQKRVITGWELIRVICSSLLTGCTPFVLIAVKVFSKQQIESCNFYIKKKWLKKFSFNLAFILSELRLFNHKMVI